MAIEPANRGILLQELNPKLILFNYYKIRNILLYLYLIAQAKQDINHQKLPSKQQIQGTLAMFVCTTRCGKTIKTHKNCPVYTNQP